MAPNPSKPRRRTLVTFDEDTVRKLIKEARMQGLRLATYIKHLVATHPERAFDAPEKR